MKCSCAALAALLEALDAEVSADDGTRHRASARNLRSDLAARTRATVDQAMATCAGELGVSVDDVRDLCAMFPPLEECGRYS